jgi:serine protease Do
LPNTQEAKADANGGDSAQAMDVPHFGKTVASASSVAGAGKTGGVVTGVDPNGAAADHGFKEGDVILEVAGKSMATTNEMLSEFLRTISSPPR